MRTVRGWQICGPLGALLLLVGCGGETSADEPESQAVTVKFHLADFDTAYYDCEGTGGYSDIGSGTSVTVRDGSGEVLGAAKLGDGKPSSNGVQAAFCDWTVKVPNVPAGKGFYAVEVGSRGEVTVSEEDLAADDWEFTVSLGD